MRITISNFRKIQNFQVNVTRGQMTLLKGRSGAGKTTILEAIRWCLYGAMRNITPSDGKTRKVVVEIDTEDLVIHRQKNPERLLVTDREDEQYEDKVAQSIIDELYGPKEVWISCSYISQKMRCILLTVSQNDKIDILNKISFHNEDPRQHIEKIKQLSKDISTQHQIKSGLFQNLENSISADIQNYGVDMDQYLPDNDYAELLAEISRLKADVERLTGLMMQQSSLQGEHQTLTLQQSQLMGRVSELAECDDDQLAEMRSDCDLLKKCLAIQISQRNCCQQLVQIFGTPDYEGILEENSGMISGGIYATSDETSKSLTGWTDNDYIAAVKTEMEHQSNRELSASLSINYNPESFGDSVAAEVEKCRSELDEIRALEESLRAREKILADYQDQLAGYQRRKAAYVEGLRKQHSDRVLELQNEYQKRLVEYTDRKTRFWEQVQQFKNQYLQQKNNIIQQVQTRYQEYDQRKAEYDRNFAIMQQAYNGRKQAAYQQAVNAWNEYNNQVRDIQANFVREHEQRNALVAEINGLKGGNGANGHGGAEIGEGGCLATFEELQKQHQLIQQLHAQKDVLTCPQCQTGLTLVDKELKLSTVHIDHAEGGDIETRIREAGQKLKLLEQGYANWQKLVILEDRLKSLPPILEWTDYFLHYFRGTTPKNPEAEGGFVFTEEEPRYNFLEKAPQLSVQEAIDAELAKLGKPAEYNFSEPQPTPPEIPVFDEATIVAEYNAEDPPVKPDLPDKGTEDKGTEDKGTEEDRDQEGGSKDENLTQRSNQLQQKIGLLEKVKYVPLPETSSAQIRAEIELRNKLAAAQPIVCKRDQLAEELAEVAELMSEEIDISDDISGNDGANLARKVAEVEQQIRDYEMQLSQKRDCVARLDQIEARLAQIYIDPTLEEQLRTAQVCYEQHMIQSQKAAAARQIFDRQTDLKSVENEILTLVNQIQSSKSLLDVAINLESQFLETTLNNINLALEDILGHIFDDPITVRLSLFKETKTTKKLTIRFNLIINYMGTCYDNINQLSGGEGDRVSLAVILALNRVNNSPFLLLDECISSLDTELKERCISTIQNSIPESKAVISVSHDCVEGYYDNIIDI